MKAETQISRLFGLALVSCSAITAGTQPMLADAAPPEDLAGHRVELVETEDFTRSLRFDGESVLEDEVIVLDAPAEVAGVKVLTGIAGGGGNACNATPFVLTVKDGLPAIDGPIASCAWFERDLAPDHITFRTEALPGVPAEIWTWTPSAGLVANRPETFSPDPDKGWSSFASLQNAHPIEALELSPVYAMVSQGLGPEDWARYTRILAELGSGDLVGDGYRGTACMKFDCANEYAWLWIDPKLQAAFVLWKSADETTPHVWPPAGWPEWVVTDAKAQGLQPG